MAKLEKLYLIKFKKQNELDALNVLYVAMTRPG